MPDARTLGPLNFNLFPGADAFSGRRTGNVTKEYQRWAEGLIEGKVLFDAPLKPLTSMRVGGPADCLLFPKDGEELRRVVLRACEKGIPLFVLGGGTNLIVRDKGVRGWVLCLRRGLTGLSVEGGTMEAEAGLSLRSLVRRSADQGLAGLEPFFGIPGTVGGALAMNAGAWGAEMKDVVQAVTFLSEKGEWIEQGRSELRFSYRSLSFPESWIIVKGRFGLSKGSREEILGRIKSYSERRKKHQPLDHPSAGSVFKNPEQGPAGRWIEAAGLKGFRMGQAMVSDRHANFIVNLGEAKAEELVRLMEWVERKVFEEKGISLEREVRVVGE